MRLNHLLPYDHCVFEGPISAADAVARLKARTAFIRRGAPRPEARTFDGHIGSRHFDVSLWPERSAWLWNSRTVDARNMARPICQGEVSDGPRGCRVEVTLRPRLLDLVLIAMFATGTVFAVVAAWLDMPSGNLPFSILTGIMAIYAYLSVTIGFWRWRDRTVTALAEALRVTGSARHATK